MGFTGLRNRVQEATGEVKQCKRMGYTVERARVHGLSLIHVFEYTTPLSI